MKIIKLLNKANLIILLVSFLIFAKSLNAEDEPVDIWELEKKTTENSLTDVVEEKENIETIFEIKNLDSSESISTINSSILNDNENKITGLYDPEENNLNINMWIRSDGNEIKSIYNKISKLNLSEDSNKILNIALLTNSHAPSKNINENDFVNLKLDYLIKNNDKKLIELYLLKNQKNFYNSKLIKYLINSYLEDSDLDSSCNILKKINYVSDDYIDKFKIYCLINNNKREEAQLLFDLNNETGKIDDFYNNKFIFLMGYIEDANEVVLDNNILNFHLSHRTNSNFYYQPDANTPKFIWKYLSSSNLLENVDTIDLEDAEKIILIEQATHEENYQEKELFELYKRFQFNINQLLNAKENYKLLKNYEARALIYQRLILTKDTEELLFFAEKLKQLFSKDNIENAFNKELKKILSLIEDQNVIPSNYTSFYLDNIKNEVKNEKKIKINNKIIHQSKLLKFFEEKYEQKKAEEELNKFLNSIKKNKKYAVSTKDLIMLEALVADGLTIKKKYISMFKFDKSNIPTDIQLLISNNEIGMVLFRLVEIIGEDRLENLDPETLYFISSILNELKLTSLRNKILLEVLPLKI